MPLHDRHDSNLEWGGAIGGQGNVDGKTVAGALTCADNRRCQHFANDGPVHEVSPKDRHPIIRMKQYRLPVVTRLGD
jgi:hypothetical protein